MLKRSRSANLVVCDGAWLPVQLFLIYFQALGLADHRSEEQNCKMLAAQAQTDGSVAEA